MTLDNRLVIVQQTSLIHKQTNDRETPNKLPIVLYSAVDAKKVQCNCKSLFGGNCQSHDSIFMQ